MKTVLIMLAAAVTLLAGEIKGETMNEDLNEFEKKVLFDKATEPPFSGKYYDLKDKGSYHCKNCGAKLFHSTAKFDSGTGWPSFDDAVDGAIKEVPDSDGMRTEIVCANCGAHLGHVFTGEGFTDKNVRHCVNSAALDFNSSDEQ